MGLDAVELVMEVEDHFGISIDDHEAQQVRTVGDLVALIRTRIETARREVCPTLRSVLSLRRTVREVVDDTRARVRTRALVVDRLDRRERQQLWRELSSTIAALPWLRRPGWLRWSLGLTTTGLMVAFTWSLVEASPALPMVFVAALGWPVAGVLATRPMRWVSPEGWTTFGDIARKYPGAKVATKQTDLETDEQVFDELRPIIASQLGIAESKIVVTSSFVNDLGLS
ncbi:phosphopantetheine-binding protein [Aeoliella mucimassa]|uniref:Acyl carrier protein n=1 Tax=Aeoliella mucimassa TaxID=2527972 RepID=A0A518AMP6_9BACT|nr:phosphopantetheine-binding protein [Aeoliella mucimassa]QDU55998.1 Acyl carrier protein [Aeoliella mucimassa]